MQSCIRNLVHIVFTTVFLPVCVYRKWVVHLLHHIPLKNPIENVETHPLSYNTALTALY
jgi:hypothetical protein